MTYYAKMALVFFFEIGQLLRGCSEGGTYLFFTQTWASFTAEHGPQSSILLGESIHSSYDLGKASWVHVLTHSKKSRSICP